MMDRRKPQIVQPPSVAGMAPPHDLGAEASTLSAMLLKPSTVFEVRDEIDLNDFFSESNRTICETIFWLDDQRIPVDLQTVASRLRETQRLQQVGGAAYLAQVCDATPAVHNVREHARIVRTMAVRRLRIACAQTLNAFQYGSPREDHSEHIEALRAALDMPDHKHVTTTRSSVGAALSTGIQSLMEQHAAKGAGILGVSTGIASLDAALGGLHASETVFVSAPSGNGKTSLASQLALAIAQQGEPHPTKTDAAGLPVVVPYGVLVFTFEMTREEYALKMACTHGGVDYSALRAGTATAQDWSNLRGAQIEIDRLAIQIDDCSKQTPRELERRMDAVRREMEASGVLLRAIIVDQMGLLEPSTKPSNNANDERIAWGIGKELRDINLTQAGKRETIIVLSQENKMGKLARSSAIREHAVVWISVKVDKSDSDGSWRSKRYPAEFSIKKQRFGGLQTLPMWFDGPITKFTDGAEQRVMRLPKAAVLKDPAPPNFSFNAIDEESPL